MNPFYFYIMSNIICLLIYQLNWSNSFGKISTNLMLFYLFTILISFLLGFILNNLVDLKFKTNDLNINFKKHLKILLILCVIQIILQPNVPLLSILLRGIDNHLEYGIPLVFPFILTFSSFLGVAAFYQWLHFKEKIYLLYVVLTFIPSVIFFMRGISSITLLAIIVMFFIQFITKIQMKQFLLIIVVTILSMYLFGVAGNARLPAGQDILVNGNASIKFTESGIPKEFFWIYMYIASSIANLVLNTSFIVTDLDFIGLFTSEIVPNIISQFFAEERIEVIRLLPTFTVGTLFTRGYNYFGWAGIYIMFVIFSLFNFFWLILINTINKRYIQIINVFLCTTAFFTVFTNMMVETSIVFPLILCSLFGYFTYINKNSLRKSK
ncbi:O-antigen polymerase [Macrococcus animalis]|uniref:O-antigen polymerase n=1 Tax=Macrococcus animalis TaxID=3395467 RepID=UPI0039BE0D9D